MGSAGVPERQVDAARARDRMVAGREGTRKLMSLVRTACDLKLWHLQFNIVNRKTLLAA